MKGSTEGTDKGALSAESPLCLTRPLAQLYLEAAVAVALRTTTFVVLYMKGG